MATKLSALRSSLTASLPVATMAEQAATVKRPKPYAAKEAAVLMGVSEDEADLYAIACFLGCKPDELTGEAVEKLSKAIQDTCKAHPGSYTDKKGQLVTDALPNGIYLRNRPAFVKAFLYGKPVADPIAALSHAVDLMAHATRDSGLFEEVTARLAQ